MVVLYQFSSHTYLPSSTVPDPLLNIQWVGITSKASNLNLVLIPESCNIRLQANRATRQDRLNLNRSKNPMLISVLTLCTETNRPIHQKDIEVSYIGTMLHTGMRLHSAQLLCQQPYQTPISHATIPLRMLPQPSVVSNSNPKLHP